MRKKGFTLIELLVVISIIALLVSILMPALGKAREQAKTTVCLADLGQLVMAWSVYCQENDDIMPGPWNNTPLRHGGGHPWDWAWAPWKVGGSDSEGDAIQLGNLKNCTEEERKEGIRKGSMFPYIQNPDLCHCPSDKLNYRTYSLADSLNGDWGKNRMAVGNWISLTKISQIKRPSEKYTFLEENDPRGYNMNSWVLWQLQNAWSDPLTVWHNGGSNLAFADGRAANRKWSEEVSDFFINYQWGQILYPKTPEGIEDLKYMQRGWPD